MKDGNELEVLVREFQETLKVLEQNHADAIDIHDLSPYAKSFVKLYHNNQLRERIPKNLVISWIKYLKQEISKENENLGKLHQAHPEMENTNKAQSYFPITFGELEINGKAIKELQEKTLDPMARMIQKKYKLERKYTGKALIATYIAQGAPSNYVSQEKILSTIRNLNFCKDATITNIKSQLFGDGRIAKKLQLELFDNSPQLIDGKRVFKLKKPVFGFIHSLVTAPKEGIEFERELLNHATSFLCEFTGENGLKPYYKLIKDAIIKNENNKPIIINWGDLMAFDILLAKELVENPDLVIDAFRNAFLEVQEHIIKEIDDEDEVSMLNLRFSVRGLPNVIRPRDINHEHTNKLVAIKGVVSGNSNHHPFFHVLAYQCPDCGEEVKILQEPFRLVKKPQKCPRCGQKNMNENINASEKYDIQRFTIQDSPEDLRDREQFKKVMGYELGLQTGKLEGGNKVLIHAIVRVFEKFDRNKSAESDYILEVLYCEPIEKDSDTSLTPRDIDEILALKEKYGDDLPKVIAASIAPRVMGNQEVKKALALAIIGAEGAWNKRTSIHVLLVGDPGTGKTEMVLDLRKIAPKVVLAEGSSSTGVGLTATVQKDEITGEFLVYGGALVVGSGGIVIIDEFTNLKPENIDHLRMAMEQEIIAINKANISNMVFKANATIVATGNPKKGYVDRHKPILEQLAIPTPVLSRFDVVLGLLDFANEKHDEEIISSMTKEVELKGENPREIPTELIKKYFVYAKTRIFPELTNEAKERIHEIFKKLRKETGKNNSFPINRRFGDTLIRLSYAHAKLRLSDKVKAQDVTACLGIIKKMLETVAIDPESGKIDTEMLETGMSSKTTAFIEDVLKVIKKYDDKSEPGASISKVVEEVETAWHIGVPREKIYQAIFQLEMDGRVSRIENDYLRVNL